MPDATLYRVTAGTAVLVTTIDAVLGFEGRRDARSVTTPIPAGGNAILVRPHGPRAGTFRLGFRGTSAQQRAAAAEASLATGALHYFTDTPSDLGGTWRFSITGQIGFERVHDLSGRGWIVSADWTGA